MAFEFIKPGSTGRMSITLTTGVMISISSEGAQRKGIRVRIGVDAMQKMRWIAGDRVQIGFDRDHRLIKIVRVNKDGYLLTAQTSSARKKGKTHGVSCNFRMLLDRIPEDVSALLLSVLNGSPYQTDDCIFDSEGITFDWPRGGEK